MHMLMSACRYAWFLKLHDLVGGSMATTLGQSSVFLAGQAGPP
jgi:hypothetical protein